MKYRKGTFITVPNKDSLFGKNSAYQALYMWLCSHADENGECFPSRALLSRELGASVRTVDKYLDELIADGLIIKTLRKKKGNKENMSNMYQIMICEETSSENLAPGDEKKDTTPSAGNSTVTKSNINSTHLTNIKEKEDNVILPVKDSKSYIDRLAKLYGTLFKIKMGFSPKIEFGRDGKILSSLKKEYSELQIASMMVLYFDWRGMEDNDDRGYQWLLDNAFPITIMKSKINSLEAYMRNVADVNFDDDRDLLKMVMKSLDKLKDK